MYICIRRCAILTRTHTHTHVHAHAKTHMPAAKNERSHANPQMCRMTRGEMRTGGLGGGVECLEGGKGRGFDRGGESEEGRAGCLLLFKRQWVLCAD